MHAGNIGAVHPHVRGEYAILTHKGWNEFRFTPTCVGNTESAARTIGCTRFTPTCVGNTTAPSGRSMLSAVHPHVRGEYGSKVLGGVMPFGSPPRAWGIRGPIANRG